MNSPKLLFLILSILVLAGCGSAFRLRSASPQQERTSQAGKLRANEGVEQDATKSIGDNEGFNQNARNPAASQVSLQQANQSQSIAEAMDRKIIRDAELTLEVGAPAEVQRKITSIAESLGGFVVTSESKQRQVGDAQQELEVNLVVRVPATQFMAALDQIHSAGNRVVAEKITGQDVTEEFIDLEARIRTQKALEAQFLEIMKDARKVPDALEVQRQIAEVRTEIEKLEGRKRFLENRASLSTITVNLQTPTAIAVNTSGFGRKIREAIADSIEVAIAIVLFLIQFVIVMIPVFIMIILPLWIIGRLVLRRMRKKPLARQTAETISEPQPE